MAVLCESQRLCLASLILKSRSPKAACTFRSSTLWTVIIIIKTFLQRHGSRWPCSTMITVDSYGNNIGLFFRFLLVILFLMKCFSCCHDLLCRMACYRDLGTFLQLWGWFRQVMVPNNFTNCLSVLAVSSGACSLWPFPGCLLIGGRILCAHEYHAPQASTLTAGPLFRQIFSPSLASRASGPSSPLARKGQWPSVRTTRCLFCAGPKRKSDLRIKSKTMRKSDLSRRIHLFSVIRPTPFISGFPSLGHPSPDSGKQQWLYPALSDRRVCVTETGSRKASASAVSVNDTMCARASFAVLVGQS